MANESGRIAQASYVIAAVAAGLVLYLHLLPALVAGLLVYVVVGAIAPLLERRLSGELARQLAVAMLGTVVVALLATLIIGAVVAIRHQVGNPETMADRVMPIIDHAREQLPAAIVAQLPVTTDDLRATSSDFAHRHSSELQMAGEATAITFGRILIGLILGALIALAHERPTSRSGALTRELGARASRLGGAFHDIVFAQSKIAAINTACTAVFLLVVMPLAGSPLPFAKTLVLITLLVGFIPVAGNLISNTLIVIVALSVSMWAAIAALVFLVLLHKFEYFLNARIVGSQIHARAWELLTAMLLMEAAFGLAGLAAGPIYYAYLKDELSARGLV